MIIDQLKTYLWLIAIVASFVSAWTIQGWRLDAANAKYDKFVIQTEVLGKEAEAKAEAQRVADLTRKEQADAENKRTIDSLRTDNKRLRDERAKGSYVPPTSPSTGSSEVACFNRADLESAIQRLDAEVSELIGEGANAVGDLNTAKRWANTVQ